jgi:hypothetical protein
VKSQLLNLNEESFLRRWKDVYVHHLLLKMWRLRERLACHCMLSVYFNEESRSRIQQQILSRALV